MFWCFTQKNTRRNIGTLQDIASKYNTSYRRSIEIALKYVNKDKGWINSVLDKVVWKKSLP